uniref:Amidohydrolase-related domain-containing protein n=1 Tax=Panagrolaimus superbus TaxID=310955 RepID=A0A914Z6H3_9BILA
MADYRGKIVEPNLVWINDKFEAGIKLKISQNGIIEEISREISGDVVELPQFALIPGFINAHSHAFHRNLRGQSGIGCQESDTFWKWRDAMYKLVENISYDNFKQLCKGTFEEMINAGITTVGEFHYVHHENDRFNLDNAVIEAAQEAGIRLVLIETLYSRSGFNAETVNKEQKRFESKIDEFIKHLKILEKSTNSTTTLAVAAHSTRAVDTEGIQTLWRYASENNKSFHIHLEEQPKEIEDCINSFHRLRPSELLLDKMYPVTSKLTVVHCTYTLREHLNVFAKKDVNICICPLTEGFLGDGIPDLNDTDHLCLGTDCNNRINFLEEMRWLTYCQNMKHNRRNCCKLDATKLLQIATFNGAKSLGLEGAVGKFEVGQQFDYVAFDLESKRLKDFKAPNMLLDAVIFGAGNEEIAAVGVAGIERKQK